MKTINFNNFEDFAYEVDEKFKTLTDDDKNISVIAKYEETRQMIKELLCIGYHIRSISSLEDPEFDGYDDEYIITVTNIDEDSEVWCEPMKRNGNYIHNEATITYVLGNCSSKLLTYCESDNIYEVNISQDDCKNKNNQSMDCTCIDHDCKKCTIESDDGNSTYYITINGNIDMKNAEKIIKDIGHRITHMQDMFDEMNHFRRLFMW